MPHEGSVTRWIEGLRRGDPAAAERLWQNYFHALVRAARGKLGALPRAAADEEDVALSAFDSFCRGAGQGRFPRLADRDDLWQVLLMITQRKAIDLLEHEGRGKRDWRRAGSAEGEQPGREPDPAFAALVADECRRLLSSLSDDGLRAIAVRKMEGFTNEEIAAGLGCSVVTVERRLKLIRHEWEGEGGEG